MAMSPASSLAKKTFPRRFGRYMLEKNLSRGGMGEVFLALPIGVARRCVIKTIRADLTGEEEFIGRFQDEAKIMVRIGHKNIIRVFDCGKVGPEYYIAMEYVHGRDLGDVLDRAYERGEPLPKEIGVLLTRNILEGLHEVHTLKDEHDRPMNLVHRDISPQNVLIGFDGSIKLIDFGLARTELLPARTQGALAVGKYGYMPPEQARHEKIDGRADIYATGVMLFEVFTGDRLVDEQDQATLWARVLNPKHRKPTSVVPSLPRELDDLIMQAVATRADDRFQSARSMLGFVDSLQTRPATADALVEYLRYLYPRVDFKPPPLPNFEFDDMPSEKSMIIALSEEGAKTVFGRGELPVEWTRQIQMADIRAEYLGQLKAKAAAKARAEKVRARSDSDVKTGTGEGLIETGEVTFGVGEDRTISTNEARIPSGEATHFEPLVRTLDDSQTSGANAATTERPARSVADQFPDDEATVMMKAPPRHRKPEPTAELTPEEHMEPTRLDLSNDDMTGMLVRPEEDTAPVSTKAPKKPARPAAPPVTERPTPVTTKPERPTPPPPPAPSAATAPVPAAGAPKSGPNFVLLGLLMLGATAVIVGALYFAFGG